MVALPELSLNAHTTSEMRTSQLDDLIILQCKERGYSLQVSQADNLPHRQLTQLWDQLTVRESVLYHLFVGPDDTSNHLQLVVPSKLCLGMLDALYGGVEEVTWQWWIQDGAFGANTSSHFCRGAMILLIEILNLVRAKIYICIS